MCLAISLVFGFCYSAGLADPKVARRHVVLLAATHSRRELQGLPVGCVWGGGGSPGEVDETGVGAGAGVSFFPLWSGLVGSLALLSFGCNG